MGHPFKDTISLQEAMHHSEGPLAFNLMIKPAGSLCNLDCHYCYYLDKADIYGGRQPKMSLEMLETITKEYIKANDVFFILITIKFHSNTKGIPCPHLSCTSDIFEL